MLPFLTELGNRWVPVYPPVFKTGDGGEKLPRWVRFPHIPAKNKVSGCSFWGLHAQKALSKRTVPEKYAKIMFLL